MIINVIRIFYGFHNRQERPDIQRVFVFSLYTGIRFCDIKRLTYANVDFSSRILRFNQVKSEGRSAHSAVVMPLSDDRKDMNRTQSRGADIKGYLYSTTSNIIIFASVV